MKLNKDTAEFLDYRHEMFDKQLKEINNIVTGRNTKLSAFINDENEKISDEKIDRLISDMLECLVNYKQQLYSHSHYKLSDETRELYECFLYCTIQGIAYIDYVDIVQLTEVEKLNTFSDILDILYNSFTYQKRMDLLSSEYKGYCAESTDFFRCCNIAYEILKDADITEAYTEAETELVRDMYRTLSAKENFIVDDDHDYDDDYDFDDNNNGDDYFKQIDRQQLEAKPELSYEELFDKLYGITDEYEQTIPDDELEYYEKANASHDEWKSTVVNPEKFIGKYLRYRELFFSTDHSNMRKDIEKMIDVFLYEQGLSAFSLGDKYAMISYRTDRYRDILKSEIRKARFNK